MGHEFEPLSGKVIEAALAVHTELGPGFLESIYENAMKVALRHREVPYKAQEKVRIAFEGEVVGEHRLDLLPEETTGVAGNPVEQIVVELKAIKALEPIHFATLRSYLRATGLRVGLLFNFNAPTLVTKRVVL